MKKMKILIRLLPFGMVLLGCSKENHSSTAAEATPIIYDLIASENSLPANFDEIAFVREEPPPFQYLVRFAENQSEFEELWKTFKLKNPVPYVDFGTSGTIFIGLFESSCTSEIVDIKGETETITITIQADESPCDHTAIPKTFVIENAKEMIQTVQAVTIAENNVNTSVPISN